MRLLLISNSTNPGEPYLDYPKQNIMEFLGSGHVKALFIPYAVVTFSFDDYEIKVRDRFSEIGNDVISIHHYTSPVKAVKKAGGTREQRIQEFIEVNADLWVAGIREGTMLLIENDKIRLIGPRKARIFRKFHQPLELGEKDDFSFLLK